MGELQGEELLKQKEKRESAVIEHEDKEMQRVTKGSAVNACRAYAE